MNTNSIGIKCPKCGEQAAGKFCSSCGNALATVVAAPPKQASLQTIIPWVIAGVAIGVVIVTLMSAATKEEVASQAAGPFMNSGTPSGQPPDLSQMTPREAADRLFNRIMTAAQGGDTTQALQFVPMALQAYEMVGKLDADARYHVGLIHVTAGDIESAHTQANLLLKAVPNHLLGLMLEHTVAKRRGEENSATRTYKRFLSAYEGEMATRKAEYLDHETGIASFHRAATASVDDGS